MYSMTGFSSHTEVVPIKGKEKTSLLIEIKSLNSRFFECTCKLPSSMNFLEIDIVNRLKQKLIRGRVFLSVRAAGQDASFERAVLVDKVANDYITACKKLKKDFSLKGDVAVADIIMLPNIFSFECEKIGKSFKTSVLKMVDAAVDKLLKARKVEGASLQADLKKRFDICVQRIEEIKKFFDTFMKDKKAEAKKILARVQKGDEAAEIELTECYELINKIDIHEEIVRFKSHLRNVKKLLSDKGVEKGKRFEFTLQELAREINTIAAKCSHYDISSVAVDIKVELEKVREQVQNIV